MMRLRAYLNMVKKSYILLYILIAGNVAISDVYALRPQAYICQPHRKIADKGMKSSSSGVGWVTEKVSMLFSYNKRQLRNIMPLINKINSFERELSGLSDKELRGKTALFKQQIKQELTAFKDAVPGDQREFEAQLKELSQRLSDDILPEAFAVIREAAKRTLGMRHYDVQLMGGIVLHQGKIAEMATGEGKTLTATLPVYLNALFGKGVHVVTVNDYLARRDCEIMKPLYEFLGLSAGLIQRGMKKEERAVAYSCDITYGTNSEFGFDYLRDNMVKSKEDIVQREPFYALLDEVDNILIDEARTPLIISGLSDTPTDMCYFVNNILPELSRGKRDEKSKEETGDYIIDEKLRTAYLTEQGEIKAAKLLGIENMHTVELMEYRHRITQAIKAHELFRRDTDYLVISGSVVIIDEFTGRPMDNRRWSDGLQQAIEAKEGINISPENHILASVTYQNYFRMYKKLSGMTGTAVTSADELFKIYGLDVVTIPTNRPLVRTYHNDALFMTENEKLDAIVEEVKRVHDTGRPVLIGAVSIDRSEGLSRRLKEENIPHQVLNAKNHEAEAAIIAQAGRLYSVTIATNMAGRGTDILLGGNPEAEAGQYKKIADLGGLHVIGTERHEARRIDNQLSGRSGRQGDPGSSRFFMSLEDDIMRIHGADMIAGIMRRFNMPRGQKFESTFITNMALNAQKRSEEHNFTVRKHLLEYDNVVNDQRSILYSMRREILFTRHIMGFIDRLIDNVADVAASRYLSSFDNDSIDSMADLFSNSFEIDPAELELMSQGEIGLLIAAQFKEICHAEGMLCAAVDMEKLQRDILIALVDRHWSEHINHLSTLRSAVGFRAYAEKDPLTEYKFEAYTMFKQMLEYMYMDMIEYIIRLRHGDHKMLNIFFMLKNGYYDDENNACNNACRPGTEMSLSVDGLQNIFQIKKLMSSAA
jgi:preprotein translocase subunit SecA